MLSEREIEQAAWDLGASGRAPDRTVPVAFLLDERPGQRTLYFSRFPGNAPPWAATSAVVQLIQGIHEFHPTRWRHLLRKRIFATAANEMCQGMVKVAAKRLTCPVSSRDHGISLGWEMIEIQRLTPPLLTQLPLSDFPARSDADFLRLARRLASDAAGSVAALLVSPENTILSWAVNRRDPDQNQARHAEVRMIQDYWLRTGRPIPRYARIYTTLKPCKMCAGMIWETAEDVSAIEVVFREMDEGRYARHTVLDPETHARRRACRARNAPVSLISRQLSRQLDV